MVNNQSPSDFYEELSSSDRRIVDKWKEIRSSLLRDQLVKEIEEKISELGKDTSPSTSFLRLLVQTPEDHLSNSTTQAQQATLTIWSPNEEQLDAIKENATLRVKNAEVKQMRFNGLLQLSGGSSVELRDGTSHERNIRNVGNISTPFPNLFRLFVNASKQMVDRTTNPISLRHNIVGMVLSLECIASGWSMLLSDETGKMLRLRGDDPAALEEFKNVSLGTITAAPLTNLRDDSATVAAFQNVIMTGIDVKQSCLLARYSSESSFIAPPSPRKLALRKWGDSPRGRRRLLQAICSLELGLCNPFEVLVGNIIGMHLVPSKELILEVDSCGRSRTLKLPLSLILSLSPSRGGSIYFTEKEESQIEQFHRLSQILRSRKSLYTFGTSPAVSDCGVDVQVTRITKTPTLALATLYSTLMTEHSNPLTLAGGRDGAPQITRILGSHRKLMC